MFVAETTLGEPAEPVPPSAVEFDAPAPLEPPRRAGGEGLAPGFDPPPGLAGAPPDGVDPDADTEPLDTDTDAEAGGVVAAGVDDGGVGGGGGGLGVEADTVAATVAAAVVTGVVT